MSDWHNIDFAPQGWQCPICKRVYSPTTPMCYYCGNGVPYTASRTTVTDGVNDWLQLRREYPSSITKSEKPEEGR